MGGKKNHLKEGDGHGEEHPDVDHLDVRCDRQTLGKAQEAEIRIVVNTGLILLEFGHICIFDT